MMAAAVLSASAIASAPVHAGPQYAASLSGAEAMWELPPEQPPHALMLLAHGCSHAGTDFWPPTSSCPKALGLPEEVRIVQAALAAGYAVLAITSSDRSTGCWDFTTDGPLVRDALTAWYTATGLRTLPLVAFGASSGGAFVLQLPALLPCAAVVSQIMALPPSMLPPPQPPILFVHMPRDQRTASFVQKCLKRLHQNGSTAQQIEVHPKRPTADFFAERIARLAPGTAAALHGALRRAGLLDTDGFLQNDPRRTAWREAIGASPGLRDSLPGPSPGTTDSLRADESAVAEALNVAWAAHEIASDPMEATLKWLSRVVANQTGGAERGSNSSPGRASKMVELSNELRR